MVSASDCGPRWPWTDDRSGELLAELLLASLNEDLPTGGLVDKSCCAPVHESRRGESERDRRRPYHPGHACTYLSARTVTIRVSPNEVVRYAAANKRRVREPAGESPRGGHERPSVGVQDRSCFIPMASHPGILAAYSSAVMPLERAMSRIRSLRCLASRARASFMRTCLLGGSPAAARSTNAFSKASSLVSA